MRLGIAPEILDKSEKIQKFYIRQDCSPETISDVRRVYGDIEFSNPLSNEEFDNIIQKVFKNNSLANRNEILSLEKTIPINEAKETLLSNTSIESKDDDAPAIQQGILF